MPTSYPQIEAIRHGVVVSCQAGPESPLNAPHIIAALAGSAALGGAVGFRVDGPANVAAVRAIADLPIIGINKQPWPDFEVFITPTRASARAVAAAGADLIAVDGTARPRPESESLAEIIRCIHQEYGIPVMADVASLDEGVQAVELGADLVATTLAGYTSYPAERTGPALGLLRALVAATATPVIVEGRIWTVEDVRACFDLGAYAVVIGSAITVPQFITRRFVGAIPAARASATGARP